MDEILRRIAGGEFERLKKEVEKLNKEMSNIKKLLVTEEAIIESWDDEHDSWWKDS